MGFWGNPETEIEWLTAVWSLFGLVDGGSNETALAVGNDVLNEAQKTSLRATLTTVTAIDTDRTLRNRGNGGKQLR
jgi:hypothetical protein